MLEYWEQDDPGKYIRKDSSVVVLQAGKWYGYLPAKYNPLVGPFDTPITAMVEFDKANPLFFKQSRHRS